MGFSQSLEVAGDQISFTPNDRCRTVTEWDAAAGRRGDRQSTDESGRPLFSVTSVVRYGPNPFEADVVMPMAVSAGRRELRGAPGAAFIEVRPQRGGGGVRTTITLTEGFVATK